ncbi:MAG TPA: hypothetical protein VI959_02185 [Alphaproteobacteria bacterium]|nr:hypothetical protein [Alphaproteobacteria bacterium]
MKKFIKKNILLSVVFCATQANAIFWKEDLDLLKKGKGPASVHIIGVFKTIENTMYNQGKSSPWNNSIDFEDKKSEMRCFDFLKGEQNYNDFVTSYYNSIIDFYKGIGNRFLREAKGNIAINFKNRGNRYLQLGAIAEEYSKALEKNSLEEQQIAKEKHEQLKSLQVTVKQEALVTVEQKKIQAPQQPQRPKIEDLLNLDGFQYALGVFSNEAYKNFNQTKQAYIKEKEDLELLLRELEEEDKPQVQERIGGLLKLIGDPTPTKDFMINEIVSKFNYTAHDTKKELTFDKNEAEKICSDFLGME